MCIIGHVGRDPNDPAHVLAGSVGFLISKLGMHSAAGFAEALQPLGIDARHFGMLRIVATGQGLSQQELGERLSVPPSRMVAFIDELEERGLVERRRNPRDRRAHAVHLTAKGRRLYDKALQTAVDYEERFCADLSPADREQLLELLQRLAAPQGVPVGVHPGMRPVSRSEAGT